MVSFAWLWNHGGLCLVSLHALDPKWWQWTVCLQVSNGHSVWARNISCCFKLLRFRGWELAWYSLSSLKKTGESVLRRTVYEPNRVRLESSYVHVLCLHANHLYPAYPEFDGTINDLVKPFQYLKPSDDSQQNVEQKQRGKAGPPACPGKAPGLQKQRRPMSEQEATQPHLYFALGILIISSLPFHIPVPCSAYLQ